MKTVNFIEAVNSGKKFKRCDCEGNGYWVEVVNGKLRSVKHDSNVDFSVSFYTGEFILEDQTITITESELTRVLCKFIRCRDGQTPIIREALKELGLKETK